MVSPAKKDFYLRVNASITTEEVQNSKYLSALAEDMAGGDSEDWQTTIRFYRIDCEKEYMIKAFMKYTEKQLIDTFSKISKDLLNSTNDISTEYEDLVIFALRQVASSRNINL